MLGRILSDLRLCRGKTFKNLTSIQIPTEHHGQEIFLLVPVQKNYRQAKVVQESIISVNAVVGDCEKSLPGFLCNAARLGQALKNNYYAIISSDFKKKAKHWYSGLLTKWQQTDCVLNLGSASPLLY